MKYRLRRRNMNIRRFIALAVLLTLSVPLSAADGVQVPEASSGMLFALGVIGVVVGRHISRKRGK
jgi:PEP-CTERM motif